MKTIHPAIAEHVMEENEKLREALRAMLDECDPLKLNCGEPWCRARTALSQQAEPVPAQGERGDELEAIHQYAFEVGGTEGGRYMLEPEELDEVARRACEPFEDVLRSLACSLGAGGYNALTVDPAVFEQKIRWGIDQLTRPAQTEQQPVGHRECRVVGFRPGMGEVTFYVEGGVPQWMNIGETIYVSDAAPIAQTAPQPEQSGYLPLSLTELLQRYKRDLELRTFPDNEEGDYQLRWTAKEIERVNTALSPQRGEA